MSDTNLTAILYKKGEIRLVRGHKLLFYLESIVTVGYRNTHRNKTERVDASAEDQPVPEPTPGSECTGLYAEGWNLRLGCSLLAARQYWGLHVKAPMVLGHEASGVISKVGQGVTDLKIDCSSTQDYRGLPRITERYFNNTSASVTFNVLPSGTGWPLNLEFRVDCVNIARLAAQTYALT
ncbi:hypothetical protein ScPMuIL_018894 [Solemya velum]